MKPPAIPIVIPVYNPPDLFQPFFLHLRSATTSPIIVVNDGSHEVFDVLFENLASRPDVTLLTHYTNKGKGAALKTAMQHVKQHLRGATGVITVDADGQHVTADILACEALALKKSPSLIIGTRVNRRIMPLKSRMGNAITRSALYLLHRYYVRDTQSGLRYIPALLMDLCLVSPFDKYDFELDMLVHAIHARIPILEYPIETIYINRNKSSHFKTLRDSLAVAKVFVHHLKKGG